jgi:hypothetical protein
MGTASLFSAFETALSPTSEEADSALGRAISCAVALTSHFYGTGNASDHITLIGSSVRHTSLRPASDIDVVFQMPPGTYATFENYAGNGQSALLQSVRSVLAKRYPSTVIKGDGPVVIVGFSTGATVEIVPAVLCSDPTILSIDCSVPVTSGGGKWEATNYGAYFDEFFRADRARKGQLARLIRYIKAWRRAKNAVIKSMVLELMAIDFFASWDTQRVWTSHTYDDWLVRDFLGYMVANQDTFYKVPGADKSVTAGYGWRQDAATAYNDAQQACGLGEASDSYVLHWTKVFGSAFGRWTYLGRGPRRALGWNVLRSDEALTLDEGKIDHVDATATTSARIG